MSRPQHPHIVRMTPAGRGAIATILVEGPGAARLVDRVFRTAGGGNLASCPADRPIFGRFHSGSESAEELIVRCRSLTSVELHCHGGYASVRAIEEALVDRGGRVRGWQDWASGLQGDPIRAAARVALADARTERTATILLDQYHGALRRAVETVLASLRSDDPAAAGKRLETLLARARLGRHLVKPWKVTLAGETNVGKSSLINALVGYRRAIVDPGAGTTRDVVTATTAVDGWPVEFSDTAGLRRSDQPLEQAGIALARRHLAAADLVVLVFDLTRPWSQADPRMIESASRALIVYNKCDLVNPGDPPQVEGLLTSAVTGEGIEGLLGSITASLVPDRPASGAAVPFTAVQVRRLEAARLAVGRGEPRLAVEELLQLC